MTEATPDGRRPPEPAQSRSKVEFLYRELLVEIDQLQRRNGELAGQLREASVALSGLPAVLRQTAASVNVEASKEAGQQLLHAAHAVRSAQQSLHHAHQAVLRRSAQSAWHLGLIAVACSLAGGALGALITLTLLAP